MDTIQTDLQSGKQTPQLTICNLHFAICNRRLSRRAFTLVELLVVITIIGILASLITAAGVGALRTAQRNRIKTEINQMDMGLQTFKDTYQSYPPNCQVDDITDTGSEPNDKPIIEAQVLTDLKRAMKQAFPRHREPDDLLRVLIGLAPVDTTKFPRSLAGGLSSGEAMVFWLGGFSSDPKYPISGEGGPSYAVIDPSADPQVNIPANERFQHDPLQRNWVFPFEVARLQPRTSDNFFDESNNRFIEYQVNVNGVNQTRRINFWQYVPAQSEQPYLYFDASRHAPGIVDGSNLIAAYDPPAATELNPNALHVHAIKVRSESAGTNEVPIQFANKDKFQILHAGLDGEWGEEAFEEMSVHHVDPDLVENYLLYPDGPFTGDVADTITNFSEGTLEASQP